MSVQEPPQFTPVQILEAGQRAASDGRTDIARQFYEHLVAAYPGTVEARTAAHRLEQLGHANPPTLTRVPPSPDAVAVRPEPILPHPGLTSHPPVAPPPNAWQSTSVMNPAAEVPRAAAATALALPEPVRNYFAGRIIARLTTWIGAALALASLALIPVAIVSPRTLSALPLLRSIEPGPGMGLAGLSSGLGLVVLGQLVRAILDHANAARDLVAIERAKATPAAESASRPRRRRG